MSAANLGQLIFRTVRDHAYEDEGGAPVWRTDAAIDSQVVGELRYRHDPGRLFVIGVAVRYEHQQRGIAMALLRRAAGNRRSGEVLAANSERENTAEGNALLRAFESVTGCKIKRIDMGYDG